MSHFKQALVVGQQAPKRRSQDTSWQSRYAVLLLESLEVTLAKQERADTETVERLLGVLKPH